MERMMSLLEQEVDFNLSESGVHPITFESLLQNHPGAMNELLATEINYPHVNGIPELRDNIALTYDGATRDNVLVTVGAIEAKLLAVGRRSLSRSRTMRQRSHAVVLRSSCLTEPDTTFEKAILFC